MLLNLSQPSREMTRLLHKDGPFEVPSGRLIRNYSLFDSGNVSFTSEYHVKSQVSKDVLMLFTEAIQGKSIPINSENFSELLQLVEEFGFSEQKAKIVSFQKSLSVSLSTDDSASILSVLEQTVRKQSIQLAGLEAKLRSLHIETSQRDSDFETFKSATTNDFAKTQSVFDFHSSEIGTF
jgi:hypothetical protein